MSKNCYPGTVFLHADIKGLESEQGHIAIGSGDILKIFVLLSHNQTWLAPMVLRIKPNNYSLKTQVMAVVLNEVVINTFLNPTRICAVVTIL